MSYFICHGSPTLAIENNVYTQFLHQLGQKRGKPKAIVIFTAHWEEETLTISGRDDVYETIYDFGGFPDALYEIQYPAKGSLTIVNRVREMFQTQGLPVKLDSKRGLDHGSWVILHHLYPKADVPIVQISVNPFLSIQSQFQIGEAIKELENDDVLVIGSGGTVHNLWTIEWGRTTPQAWAVEFDDWLVEKVQQQDEKSLCSFQKLAPHAQQAVPREEHIVPLFIAMGNGKKKQAPKLLHRSYNYGTLSHICFEF